MEGDGLYAMELARLAWAEGRGTEYKSLGNERHSSWLVASKDR